MSQTVRFHGGGCCGITHIQGFLSHPSLPELARPKRTPEQQAAYIKMYPHYYFIVNDERPAETGEQRLRELVRLIPLEGGGYTGGRSSGIIEIVLTSVDRAGVAENWRPLLTELGFKEVNKHRNSNSGRMLHVFHLNTGA